MGMFSNLGIYLQEYKCTRSSRLHSPTWVRLQGIPNNFSACVSSADLAVANLLAAGSSMLPGSTCIGDRGGERRAGDWNTAAAASVSTSAVIIDIRGQAVLSLVGESVVLEKPSRLSSAS